ncbi:MAG: hypothetical protein JNM68_07975, partial [Dinghuibacter sp.]|nr:hypothetical protein [Dinghuibacter sp.]
MTNQLFFYIFLIPLLTSALASVRAFRKHWPGPYRQFSIFLFTVLLIELFAGLWPLWTHRQFTPPFSKNNYWVYNPFIIIEYLFYIYFFHRATGGKIFSLNISLGIGAGYLVLSLLNLFLLQGMFKYPTHTLAIASLVMVLLTSGYFIALLRSNKLVRLSTEPLFWISVGAFLYHLCCIPLFIFFNYLLRTNIELCLIFFKITTVFNWIMYSSYTIAF